MNILSLLSFTIFILLIFGGSSIKGFAFAMTVGVVVGTYSSIFIASPILVDFATKKAKEMQAKNVKPSTGSLAKNVTVKAK